MFFDMKYLRVFEMAVLYNNGVKERASFGFDNRCKYGNLVILNKSDMHDEEVFHQRLQLFFNKHHDEFENNTNLEELLLKSDNNLLPYQKEDNIVARTINFVRVLSCRSGSSRRK